jgi:CBS domain-containing protein
VVADDVVYVSKVLKRRLLDVDGAPIGSMSDVVIGQFAEADEGPPVRGFIASIRRRRIFVAASRIGWLDARGLQLASGTVDLRPFQPRGDEVLARSVLDVDHQGETVRDIGFSPSPRLSRAWVVRTLALQRRGPFRVGGTIRVVDWHEAHQLFQAQPETEVIRAFRRLHPSDAAHELLALPRAQLVDVIGGLTDHFLAEVLEELPEPDQVEVLAQLDIERAADVVEEMDPDDATDLLGELAVDRRQELLDAIEPDRGARLRQLLSHDAHTAGGLMTPDPVIVSPESMVAESLARIRNPDVPAALAAQVFVTEPPTQTPTGAYRGSVTFQRLLREPPGHPVSACLEPGPEPVGADLPELAVAQRLAAYDLLAVPVCDASGRLLGVVTVDDVLDRSLPADWRNR